MYLKLPLFCAIYSVLGNGDDNMLLLNIIYNYIYIIVIFCVAEACEKL